MLTAELPRRAAGRDRQEHDGLHERASNHDRLAAVLVPAHDTPQRDQRQSGRKKNEKSKQDVTGCPASDMPTSARRVGMKA